MEIQWTGQNIKEIIDFCEPNVLAVTDTGIEICWEKAEIGDYIVNNNGRFSIRKNNQMELCLWK